MDEPSDGAALQGEVTSTHRSAGTSAPPQRIEVIARTERRRRWSVAEKRAIVAESGSPGGSALATARKHGISSGQLYVWRGQARRGELEEPSVGARSFVRVGLLAERRSPGLIEIVLPGGATIRVDAQVDGAALRRVIEALTGR